MREVWKPVVRYEGLYEVSSLGRVRRSGRVLRPSPEKDGYLKVMLHRQDGGRTLKIHRLVMEAFEGLCPPGFEVNHCDGDKTNNTVSNLAYVTHRQNIAHAMAKLGRAFRPPLKQGEDAPLAKLTEADVRLIRKCAAGGTLTRQLAAAFGISTANVRRIVRRKTWKHVA